jgi:hypothetical protein
MEPLTLKTRQPVTDEVERWDDDADFDGFDDIQIRTASTATSSTSFSAAHLHRRDSISSRMSMRSELDSNHGDEDWQVLLPDDEQASTKDAIAVAKSKGIPIPADVPKSALQGGTIRRLGGKKIKKALGDDWSEDLELPGFGAELKLTKIEGKDFPETLRQISAAFHKSPGGSPFKSVPPNAFSTKAKAAPVSLEQFQDNDDDDDFGDVPTIKVAKSRGTHKFLQLSQPPKRKDNENTEKKKDSENIEDGLEIPTKGELKLAPRKEAPRTPQQDEEIDIEWAEGSLGTRNGGKRELRSNRSSSAASALSPSVSSCLTAESEDDGLDCLVLPSGPLNFDEALKKRQQDQSPDVSNYSGEQQAAKRAAAKDDFFADFEIGDGDVFDSGKLTLNRNIKHKTQRTTSPQRRTATTLTFTNNKSQATTTRIPRPHGGRDRPRSTLEPVSETGPPAAQRFRRPESRLSGHVQQSSLSSIPGPSLPSAPSTPSRRGLRHQDSRDVLRTEPVTTTNTQLLRSKRSMPVMRGLQSPTKPPIYARPPSRNEIGGIGSRLNVPPRPKTPTDRSESRLGDARRNAPFLPPGVSISQSQHGTMKTTASRHFRRHDSADSNEGGSIPPRPFSRLTHRPETPGRGPGGRNVAPLELTLAAKKPITKPTRRRNFGDGTELEIFDDLPTSATVENKFIKQPIGRGAPKSLRSKLGQSHLGPSITSLASLTETPMPSTPLSPTKQTYPDFTPRFARATAASRNAREQRNVSTSINATLREPPHPGREGGPLAPLSTNWKAHVMARTNANGLASPSLRKKHITKKESQKPQLIKPMGSGINEPKAVKGMQYNPVLFKWEGNENALAPFDVPAPSVGGSPVRSRDGPGPGGHSPKHSSVGQPALITNVGQVATGVQVVGGMVFDPKRMCWLKMAPSQGQGPGSGSQNGGGTSLRGGAAVGSVQLDEEEEDVFAGLEDLKEEDELTSGSFRSGLSRGPGAGGPGRKVSEGESGKDGSGSGDEGWLVSEEFDVGPEFVRRQRNEEEKWKRKVEKWLRADACVEDRSTASWRWAIRDVVSSLQAAL